ncbi:MAG: riboflavin synthase [Alphaproteobacteria bacterium]|nr:riboflavin synthase [Alphaproteobacteria bacterium]
MFTGIVTDIGRIRRVVPGGDTRLEIETAYDTASIALGASIAVAGCCLTAIEKGADWFAVQASAETLAKTTLGGLGAGARVNLERALRVGDELGGHIVSGHVDGTGRIVETRPEGDSLRVVFEAPAELARFIAPKGGIAVDGVSLTVNEVAGARFGVNLIPFTRAHTTLGEARPGRAVNLEIDLLARYVARLREMS